MEYALKLEGPQALPEDPRQWCDAAWAEALPAGRLAAIYFGSEFCEERTPSVRQAAVLCSHAAERGVEAVLLTPIVRPRGYRTVARLLRGLADLGWRPAVVFNDWGVEGLLREEHPSLLRRGGRLLNRALRDPRLAVKGVRPPGGVRANLLRNLLRRTGAAALETDADLEGGFLGPGGEGLQRTLHLPYVVATSGRHCLMRDQSGGQCRTAAGLCRAPCRTRWISEERQDTPLPLHRAGNAVVYEAPEALARAHLADADRVVFHRRPGP